MASEASLLAKLEQAELRFGLADDEKLAKLLDPALPNILGFLASSSAQVRSKVMAILSHLNKRLKGDTSIALPLRALSKQFLNPATVSFVGNFSLVYIEMGIGRVPASERGRIVSPLLVGASQRTAQQQETLLQLLIAALPSLPLPTTAAQIDESLPFLHGDERQADRKLVLAWLLDLLLYMPPLTRTLPAAENAPAAAAAAPPGLSPAAAKRICGKLSPEEVQGEMLAAKMAVLRLLGASRGSAERQSPPLFTAAETLPHLVVGSCDSNGDVSLLAEGLLRKLGKVDIDSASVIDALCALVLGELPGAAGTAGAGATDPQTQRRAASVAVRVKAIGYLSRSVAAASHFPATLQAVFHAIFGADSTPKLQEAGCQLAQWMAQHASAPLLEAAGAHLLMGLLRVLRGEATPTLRRDAKEAIAMRCACYGALALLCRRTPSLLRKDETLPVDLFRALADEDGGARTPLHEALSALADVHAQNGRRRALPARTVSSLRALLLSAATDSAPHARLAAMTWASKVFPADDAPSRYLGLLGVADERAEVKEAARKVLRGDEDGGDRGHGGTQHDGSADAAKGEADADATPLRVGERVLHTDSSGVARLATVLQAHTDDASAQYYTVCFDGAACDAERSTERSRLKRARIARPPLATLLSIVMRKSALGLSAEIEQTWVAPADSSAAAAAAWLHDAAALPEAALPETIRYLRDCLQREADALARAQQEASADTSMKDSSVEGRKAPASAKLALGARVNALFGADSEGGARTGRQLLSLLERSLRSAEASRELVGEATAALFALVSASETQHAARSGSLSGWPLAKPVADAVVWLQPLILTKPSLDDAAQRTLARIVGVSSAADASDAAADALIGVTAKLPTQDMACAAANELRRGLGAVLLTGYICSQQAKRLRDSGAVAAPEISRLHDAASAAVCALAALLSHRQPLIASAASSAIGVIGESAPLPLPEGEPEAVAGEDSAAVKDKEEKSVAMPPSQEKEQKTADTQQVETDGKKNGEGAQGAAERPPPADKAAIVRELKLLLPKEKTREAAVEAIGQILSGEPHATFRNSALEALFALASTKDIALHLKVGEALALAAVAEPAAVTDASGAAPNQATTAPPPLPQIKPPKDPAFSVDMPFAERQAAAEKAGVAEAGLRLMSFVLHRVLLQYAVDWAPLVRQAAAAWLLSILRKAQGAPELRDAAVHVQRVLVGLLADSQELTQELAAKGLSALFDSCDEATKSAILQQLVRGLQSTRAANAAASGGDMATYQELSEIAASAGQPQLVYKLMECATTSAVWNTRKGVAFALAEQSQDHLKEHLPKLVPTLYRYTFDPNPKVSVAMRQLWTSLVSDPKKVLDEHFGAVLQHMCDGLIDRLWRARESSSLALAELLPGRSLIQVRPQLVDLHVRLMRAMDDVKETVRNAAATAWRALCSTCLRLSDGAHVSEAAAAEVLALVLPVLLESGLGNATEEVRRLCTKQLLKLCQVAGAHLAPFTTRIVPYLLENLSGLEDPMLNYLQLQAANVGVSEQALEAARVKAVRDSDCFSALEQCLKVMDETRAEAILPQLSNLLVRGTGLPTRTATARFLMQLAQAQPILLRKHAMPLLRTLKQAILEERSGAARRAYASCAAAMARAAPPEPLGELLQGMLARYADGAGAEEEERLVIASLVRELQRSASDAMAKVLVDWLPMAFVGRHEPRWESERAVPGEKDEDGKLAAVWREAYDEAGGNAGAVTAHLPEVLALLRAFTDGVSWALRRAAAFALLEMSTLSNGALMKRPEQAEMRKLAEMLCDGRKMREREAVVPKLQAAFKLVAPAPSAAQPIASADM
uniref:Non-specific serine/threonine protein kinase n=2 Tax=Chrysotila carterae TaxID=13221 RepID=A0A7S4BN83_CHRCT